MRRHFVVNTWDVHVLDLRAQLLVEDVLCQRQKCDAAEELRGQDHACADGRIGERQYSLHDDVGLLEARTLAQPENEEGTNPAGGGDTGMEGCEKACADGHKDGGEVDAWRIVTDFGGEDGCAEGADELRQDLWERMDGRCEGADSVNELKPEWKVVDVDEDDTTDAVGEDDGEDDRASFDHVAGDCIARCQALCAHGNAARTTKDRI